MKLNEYSDIAPYRGEAVKEAIERIIPYVPLIKDSYCNIIGENPFDPATSEKYQNFFIERLRKVNSYDDFQREITSKVFLNAILKHTASGFTTSGLDKLEKGRPYFFISNHRDIILDCALIDHALDAAGFGMCEMAIGDNLLYNQFLVDLFKLNGGVVVRRSLPLRQKYMESIRLSGYFVDVITKMKHSIWCAQQSGRAKDGLDNTNPAIIKMLYLSRRKSGIDFSTLIKSCHIVPVAVSYELDPNDINKGREEFDLMRKGMRNKKTYEDLISMVRGITKPKGKIHIAFGEELTGTYNDPKDVAAEIDRQIHLNYRLFGTNYYAYSLLEESDRFMDKAKESDLEAFDFRYRNLRPEVKSVILNMFANPVRSRLNALSNA